MQRKDIKIYFKRMREIEKLEEKCRDLKNKDKLKYLELFCRLSELKRLTLDAYVSISLLPQEDKKMLYLKYLEKLSLKQLSCIFNVSASTIDRRINEIINKLE